MKLFTVLALAVLGTGCRMLHCDACACDSETPRSSVAPTQELSTIDHAGDDCQIFVEPGGLALEMDLSYNSTINPISIPVPPVIVEMESGSSNYTIGGVSLPANSKKNLELQVLVAGNATSSSASAKLKGVTVAAGAATFDLGMTNPVVYAAGIDGTTKNFDLIAHYNGVQFTIPCVKVP